MTALGRTPEHNLKDVSCPRDGLRGKGFYNRHPSKAVKDISMYI